MLILLILKRRGRFYYFKIIVNYCVVCSIFFHGNLMEFLTSCLWKFCQIYGILAFSYGNSRFESGSPDSIDISYFCVTWIWNFNFLLVFYGWKYEKLNFAIENINFAAGTISNIHYHVKIKAKHPANMALLTFSKFCVYLPHYERDWIGNSMAFKPTCKLWRHQIFKTCMFCNNRKL